MSSLTALLPIKSHSERIPGKNFKNFNDQPLFFWILEKLLSVSKIDQIIINTDDLDVFRQYDIVQHDKIILRNRDENIRGDFVSMNKVIENDIDFCGDGHFLMTHTTNPLLSVNTIQRAIEEYWSGEKMGFDSLFSVNRFQSRFYDENLNPINHDLKNLVRTQDLAPMFEENSCLYVFSKSSFMKNSARIGSNPKLFETPELESVDIDDYNSWNKALLSYKLLTKDEV